jgi:hypothetical protein
MLRKINNAVSGIADQGQFSGQNDGVRAKRWGHKTMGSGLAMKHFTLRTSFRVCVVTLVVGLSFVPLSVWSSDDVQGQIAGIDRMCSEQSQLKSRVMRDYLGGPRGWMESSRREDVVTGGVPVPQRTTVWLTEHKGRALYASVMYSFDDFPNNADVQRYCFYETGGTARLREDHVNTSGNIRRPSSKDIVRVLIRTVYFDSESKQLAVTVSATEGTLLDQTKKIEPESVPRPKMSEYKNIADFPIYQLWRENPLKEGAPSPGKPDP